MFIATVILFLVPSAFLAAAWRRYLRSTSDTPMFTWRAYCSVAALLLAASSTILELVFFFSWFHKGGSPHGMFPAPGIWTFVGRIAFWAFVASIVLTFFGRGRWRVLISAWAVSVCVAVLLVFALEMD